ncbi:SPOR domain-containing protein [Acidovorax sp. JG5]|uniref:SPOR domain-containing protein n=1 Tax=Acidovorax sp. JG5 TaxID=2822718 RepID=UPI001B33720F|nr:SPOR domain-containing protein [Acidovorax sp. JG5]MBP3980237.1 SPOR domain-containing protein [Acidovorax sp. JG5]
MHAATDPAATTALQPSKLRSDSAMTALYSAALGPVHLSRYLPVFARFDEAGRTTTSWNWAASLCTLNWMVFRQLWGAALVYVAAAEGLALLVFGLGRPLLQWPQAVEWGVVGAFFLLGCAVPGLYGNALLHADAHKKIARALTATHTLNETRALLARQASSWKRLAWLAAGNLALALAAAGVYLAIPSTVAPQSADPATPTPTASAPQKTDAPAATGAATPPQRSASEAAAIPAPPAAPEPAQAPPEPAALAPAPSAAPMERASRPTMATAPTAPAKRASPSQAKALAPDTAAAASAENNNALPVVGTAPGYYINVGLFANEANARRAQARLLNEGLPAFRQEILTAKKRRLRVRVGPYSDHADADAAAVTIRSMALEAVVIKLGA